MLGKDYSFLCSFPTSFIYYLYLVPRKLIGEISGYILITQKMSQLQLSSFANKLDGEYFGCNLQALRRQRPHFSALLLIMLCIFWSEALIYSYMFYSPDPVCCLHKCIPRRGPH